jgi:DNA-binding CsgD family transcriptional regulator
VDPTNGGRGVGVALAFGLVALLAIVDLGGDLRQGTTLVHALVEGTIASVGLGGIVWAAARLRSYSVQAMALRERAADLEQDLGASRADAERWRAQAADLIAGLSEAIDHQLERWELSDAEKEVALLLLKGLSHKEIAEIRKVGEATVRQQAGAIYRKAGLSGRHDLAAFFLEDLLGPRPEVKAGSSA